LADDGFRSDLQSKIENSDHEIPKQKRMLRHLPLAVIEQGKEQQECMYEAYTEHDPDFEKKRTGKKGVTHLYPVLPLSASRTSGGIQSELCKI